MADRGYGYHERQGTVGVVSEIKAGRQVDTRKIMYRITSISIFGSRWGWGSIHCRRSVLPIPDSQAPPTRDIGKWRGKGMAAVAVVEQRSFSLSITGCVTLSADARLRS